MVKTAEMVATIDPERSRVMQAVKATNTGPELAVRRFLWSVGLRYRLHVKALPGSPDIVFPSKRIALFVHGCFWHGHDGCPRYRIPKTRTEYWAAKIARNRVRDRQSSAALDVLGWTTLVIWECEVKKLGRLNELALTIKKLPARRG